MFKVRIDLPRVRLAGCPDNGIGAIDFRRANGLPEAPTSEISIVGEWHDQESLIRCYRPEFVNAQGDLVIETASDYHSHCTILSNGGDKTSYPLAEAISTSHDKHCTIYNSPIPASLAKPFFGTPTAGDFEMLLQYFVTHAAAVREEAAAKKAQRDAEDAARKAERDQAEARVAAAKKAALDKLAAWTREHGSELARLRLEDGYDCWVSQAREDYADAVALAVMGRAPDAEGPEGYAVEGDVQPRKCPTAEEIKSLRAAREKLPEGTTSDLVRVTYRPTEDEDGYADSDLPNVGRTEIRLTVGVPGAGEVERYYLIAE